MTDRIPIAPVSELKRTANIPQPPPRRPRAAQTSIADSSAAEKSEPVKDRPTRGSAREAGSRPLRKAPGDRRRTRPISLSVPAELLTEFRRFAKRTEISYADLLMDAVGAHRDDLAELVAAAQSSVSSDGLFVRATSSPTGALSTLSLRMWEVNVSALDELVELSGALSRSQMCVAALNAYLASGARRRSN